MKKFLSLTLIAMLLALFACGSAPVEVTTDPTTTAVTSSTEAPTTTEASTTTTEEASTASTTHFKAEAPPHELEYKMDENGIFYLERERKANPTEVIRQESPFSPQFGATQPTQPNDYSTLALYATLRVKFQYAGQAWMIQMWKGRYGLVLLGGEIAVLKKPIEQQAEHYLPATEEEELAISMDVYQHNFLEGKTQKLFTRSAKSAWWFNGFVPGSFYEYNKKSEIIMVGTITFPDQEMLKAFEKSLNEIGFKQGTPDSRHPETYAIKDNALTFSWQNIDQDA